MTHVVTDNCINYRCPDCVKVCPVDCFHEGPNFLVIDPGECIDCTSCAANPWDGMPDKLPLPDHGGRTGSSRVP